MTERLPPDAIAALGQLHREAVEHHLDGPIVQRYIDAVLDAAPALLALAEKVREVLADHGCGDLDQLSAWVNAAQQGEVDEGILREKAERERLALAQAQTWQPPTPRESKAMAMLAKVLSKIQDHQQHDEFHHGGRNDCLFVLEREVAELISPPPPEAR